MASDARFQLFVKAGKDGKCVGDCPFSQRANMYAHLTLKKNEFEITPVNTNNKPDYFLKINREGKVPVLVDRQQGNKVISDSAEITKYINELYPKPALKQGYTGPGDACTGGIFPKFAAMMKNKDESKDSELKQALIDELKKLNDYLTNKECSGNFLLCDNLCELDCQVLPKLRHVQVAGDYYKKFKIPEDFTALQEYIKQGESSDIFKSTCAPDEEFIWGWSKFFPEIDTSS
ncbi:uncharacterized protein LOC123525413 isoform X2 [Mercenaria mercenaria]|nr:uncharacterized protein LOC123525413 isoform X2 [Mercenaria mercenaria]